MLPCPDVETIERFVEGMLDETSVPEVESHLSSCATCRELCDEVRDNLAEAARFATGGDGEPSVGGPTLAGYEIRDVLGTGGQGVVYEGVQHSTGRRVAIKFLRERGLFDRGESERFAREVRMLAELDHPHIVTVHDSGTEEGNAFYVMDYVEGRPLHRFLEEKNPDLRARLELFATLAEAIQAAHLRGILHRDLKPSNIHVDPEGRPRILDFGLAKRVGEEATGPQTDLTRTGHFLGSLPWSSPEQVEGRPEDVDLRSDVYSLGLVLYHILTGRLPYDLEGGLREQIETIARAELTPLRSVVPTLDPDVEAIVLKSLTRDKEGRYQSAGELASDVRRVLRGDPVEARSRSRWYVIRKALRRHRVSIGIAASFVVLTASAAIVSLSLYFEADQNLQLVLEREAELKDERDRTRHVAEFQETLLRGFDAEWVGIQLLADQRKKLREALEQAERTPEEVEEALATFDGLLSTINASDLARGVIDEHVLTRAAEAIDRDFGDQPEIRAQLDFSLGTTYSSLGLKEKSLRLQRRAAGTRKELHGKDAVQTLEALAALEDDLINLGRLDEAERACRDGYERRKRVLGEGHGATLATARRIGVVLLDRNELEEAEVWLRKALDGFLAEAPVDSRQIAWARAALGGLFLETQRFDEAEEMFRTALEECLRDLGEDEPLTWSARHNLAKLFESRGNLDEASRILEAVLTSKQRALGNRHPSTLTSLMSLGAWLTKSGRVDEGLKICQQALEGRRAVLGANHPATLRTLATYGDLLFCESRWGEAEPMLRDCVGRCGLHLAPDHETTILANHHLGVLLRESGRTTEAEPHLHGAWQGFLKTRGATHLQTLNARMHYGRCLLILRRLDEARPIVEETLKLVREHPRTEPWRLADCLYDLGWCDAVEKRYDSAEPLLLEAHAIYVEEFGLTHPRTRKLTNNLYELYQVQGKATEAATWRELLSGSD